MMNKNKNTKIEACIFDLDGTLLNTLLSIRYSLNQILDKYGYRTVTKEETRIFVGKGARNLMRCTLSACGFDFTLPESEERFLEIYNDFVQFYDSNPFYLTEPYEGIKDAVLYLRSQGVKLAILSNKPDSMVSQLVKMHFAGLFDVASGAKDGIALKPDPEGVFAVCAELGVEPQNTAYFGDMGIDMITAANYGAGLSVGVSWGFRDGEELRREGADIVIDHPTEIKEAMKSFFE